MTWLLTIILISAIIGWRISYDYSEKMLELQKNHDKEVQEYQDEIRKIVSQLLETQHELKRYKGR